MANLTQDISYHYKTTGKSLDTRVVPLAGSGTLGSFSMHKGSFVFIDASTSPGYAGPLTTPVDPAADVFCGICLGRQTVGPTQTADGSVSVDVARDGLWGFPRGYITVTQADVGKKIYASDDTTLTLTSTGNLFIGTLDSIDDSTVWVDISDATGKITA